MANIDCLSICSSYHKTRLTYFRSVKTKPNNNSKMNNLLPLDKSSDVLTGSITMTFRRKMYMSIVDARRVNNNKKDLNCIFCKVLGGGRGREGGGGGGGG